MTPLKIVGQNDFSGLPQMERDKLVAEWKALILRDKVSQVGTPLGGGRGEVLAQVAPKVQGGRPKGCGVVQAGGEGIADASC